MKKSTVILVWGAIISIAVMIYSYALYATGASFSNRALSYFSYLIMIVGLVVGMLQYRKANGGYGSFGTQYKAGILMVLVIAALTTIYFMVFLQMTPDFMDKAMDQARTDMVNKGMSSEQIEMGMKYAKMFTTPTMMVVFGFIGNLIVGAILGLLAAGITAKAKPLTAEDNNTLPS
jgi:hypothetical protein